jgi:dUTP pyrophosphatase
VAIFKRRAIRRVKSGRRKERERANLGGPFEMRFTYSCDSRLERKSAGAGGYDVSASEDVVVLPGGRAHLVSTGLCMAVPTGCVGILKSRSSLALNHDVEVGAGVIDEDYRGEVKVLLRNFGPDPFVVSKGMRIAQLLLVKIETPVAEQVEECDSLGATVRGSGGFGSTGK